MDDFNILINLELIGYFPLCHIFTVVSWTER